jgi:pimeloyl-ACP methyl ester carboxylesterase
MACSFHCIRAGALIFALALPLAAAAQQPEGAAASPASKFNIYLRASQIGTEEASVIRTPEGWTIAGTGRIGAPLNVVTRRLEIKYDADWKPLELTLDASTREQPTTLHTVVTGGSARSEIVTNGSPSEKTDAIDPSAVLAPNPFFAPYEALAARLKTASAGSTIPLYTVPLGSVTATVGESTAEKLQTIDRIIDVRRTPVTMQSAGGPALNVEVWGDENGRLLRLSVPAQSLEVVREDIASVATRRVAIAREGDEQVQVRANGFSLAGTVSKPRGAAGTRLPAVVLVGGSGPTDRDETVAGIPIFGQLAGSLADAGFLVLRYDKRGVGQSGGRPESATLADYADDLRASVRYISDRRDVDRNRIAVVGHSEGGSVGMIAASKENRIRALVLVATIGVTGAELNMAQVTHALSRSSRSEAEKQSTIELQRRIQTAVLTGQGWDGIPPGLRRQAEIPWFHSFLSFDPAKPIQDIRQPILIVQGMLDTQVAPSNAERLEQLARGRKRATAVDVVKVPGVNHLLVPATTGEVDEYQTLPDKNVSPAVSGAIADWLRRTLVAK